ncbi:hypothetical protein FVE85_0571 [Porphyridium purpureum]|uniref:Flagellar associated protein n=1 Tax=Porphyridium purpureum TaxID=35688 RepID=A0A5J4Z132_PORPP|nr:hypothetical protein FVE85_0571 [Porphyridium purpureum]|eukprot:POR3867..scf208_2
MGTERSALGFQQVLPVSWSNLASRAAPRTCLGGASVRSAGTWNPWHRAKQLRQELPRGGCTTWIMASSGSKQIKLHSFAFRQFDDASYSGTRIRGVDKQAFEDRVNRYLVEEQAALVDGYAPFCKHIFMPNFTDATVGDMVITEQNRAMLHSGYEARTEKELPVLTRYFRADEIGDSAPVAKFLDLILYSRDQLYQEASAMGEEGFEQLEPWGLISIKAQDVDHELPMTPITIMRNELISCGGSGVPIDREKYMESVRYWQSRAMIKG